MGDRLRVDYAAVEGLIGDMKGYEGNIEDLYSDMTTTVSSLVSNGYMEAESATAYSKICSDRILRVCQS